MNKIVVVTRENEWEKLKPVIDRLKCDVWQTGRVVRPSWFVQAVEAELGYFYANMGEQGAYWRERFITRTDHIRRLMKADLPVIPEVFNRLETVKPDFLFVTNLMFEPIYRDYDYAVAAKKLGIPIVAFVNRLDGLTTKGPMQVEPDRVYCWNEGHKQELMKYHNVTEEKIHTVGAWSFEQWTESKEPRQKKWAYVCSSPNIVDNEHDYISEWLEYDVPKDVKPVLVPYPGQTIGSHTLSCMNDKDFESKYHLYSTCERVYGINSSAMIEAMLVGTPAYAIEGEADKTTNCLHYKHLQPFLNGYHTGFRKAMGFTDVLPSELIAKDFV